MADLSQPAVSVTAVLGSPGACDAVMSLPQGRSFRLSAGEVMVLDAGAAEQAIRRACSTDPAAVIEDVSDGWAVFRLAGADAREAFARLSELEVPERGFAQGEVARVAVRVVAERDRILLLVPSMWADHLEERIRTDAAEVLG